MMFMSSLVRHIGVTSITISRYAEATWFQNPAELYREVTSFHL